MNQTTGQGGLMGAARADPHNPHLKLQLAAVLRQQGDFPGAMRLIDDALAIDPYLLPAHLSKAILFERMGRLKLAANAYKIALEVAPSDPKRVPPQLAQALEHGREVLAAQRAAEKAFLAERLEDSRRGLDGDDLRRFDRAVGILLGERKIVHRQPIQMDYPELPEHQFYPRRLFPWLPKLEAATDMIREELEKAVATQWALFTPYIEIAAHEPVNQWKDLNHNPDWSTLHLWRDGKRDEAACAACPRTAALMDELPLMRAENMGPTVVFSTLKPHTHIPAHTGSTNTRLLCHLPLILPRNCRFRVGDETRDWKMGEAWVFDDTIEHEAWNDSDEFRAILIFDVWNPFLSDGEKTLLVELMKARATWMASDGGAQSLGV